MSIISDYMPEFQKAGLIAGSHFTCFTQLLDACLVRLVAGVAGCEVLVDCQSRCQSMPVRGLCSGTTNPRTGILWEQDWRR